jgi:hypothetical protein
MALIAMLLSFCGCGSRSGSASTDTGTSAAKVRTLTGFYEGYLGAHKGQAPPNEQAFRDYLNTKQEELQKIGITAGEMFTSPRGKPMRWIYGRTPPVFRPTNMTCFAYEVEPTDGKRLVLGGRGMTAELSDAEFRGLVPK